MSNLSKIVLGHVVAQDDIRAGDVLDIVLDRSTGTVRAERHRVRVVDVRPGDEPGDVVLDLSALTWTCMVCGAERPDVQISVAHRPVAGLEDSFPDGARVNVRHCADRADCTAAATAATPWPAPGQIG